MQHRRAVQIAVICLVVGAAHLALVRWYLESVVDDDLAELTVRQFRLVEHPIHTLAIGDSRVKWGIQPEVLGESFNFAMPGESNGETFYRLRSLLDRGLPVRTVVTQVDPRVFFEPVTSGRGYDHYYAWFADYPALGWQRGEPLLGAARWVVGRYAPYAGQRRKTLRFLDADRRGALALLTGVPMRLGAMRADARLDDVGVEARRRIARERARQLLGGGSSSGAEEQIRRTLDLCRQRDIRVLLVAFPVSSEYRNALSGSVDLPAYEARIAKLAGDFENVRILDVRDYFAGQTDLFADIDHLNIRGAARVSRLVKQNLLDGGRSAPRM